MAFADVRRTLFVLHMWIGLVLGLLLVLLGLSGSALVYDDKIADMIAPPPKRPTAQGLDAAAGCDHRRGAQPGRARPGAACHAAAGAGRSRIGAHR